MAGIEFDRHVFAPDAVQARKLAPRLAGTLVLLFVIAGLVFAGYKLQKEPSLFAPSAQTPSLDKMQQQLEDVQKRLADLEKHRKNFAAAPAAAAAKTETANSTHAVRPAQPADMTSAANGMKSQNTPAPSRAANSQPVPATPRSADNPSDGTRADHEAWEATTDRLADVVGMVGSQQGELSEARGQLNELLAQSHRTAMQFELRRGKEKQSIGPVSLLLRASDPKSQRYSLCVYLEDRCIELRDRVVDEVVILVVSHDAAPLELVATKVGHDAIAGYLQVPKGQPTP